MVGDAHGAVTAAPAPHSPRGNFLHPLDRGEGALAGGWLLVPGKGALVAPRTIPLAFPSLAHLDERVATIQRRMDEVEGLRAGTVQWTTTAYRIFRRFLLASGNDRRFLGGDLPSQLGVLEAWVGDLRATRSRVTVNNYWRALALLFVRLNHLHGMVNPLAFLPTPKYGRREPRYLPRPAAERVLTFVLHHQWASRFEQSRNLAVIGMMVLSGLRRGEVLKLQYGHVDPDAGTIRIVGGKGRHGGNDRTAHMPAQLRSIIRAYQARRGARALTTTAFFVSARRDAPLHVGAIRHLFRRIASGTGTPVTPHMLRHTYATLLRQTGVADRVAMDLLGHASLDMLQRYSHVADGEAAHAATLLRLDVDVPSDEPPHG
ncbi:MAG: site-specific integrase [Acidobacteriota bacterium]|nr:site-specific integrase [Acidobacteriota bacterium]